jgi:hypothetical protein
MWSQLPPLLFGGDEVHDDDDKSTVAMSGSDRVVAGARVVGATTGDGARV